MNFKTEMKSILFGAAVGISYIVLSEIYKSLRRKHKKEIYRPPAPDINSPDWKYVGKLSNIHIYPLKSGKGITVDQANTTKLGLKQITTDTLPLRDRFFIVYREDNHEMITSRVYPKLLQCSLLSDSKTSIKLSYPNNQDIVINLPTHHTRTTTKMWRNENVECWDCGDEVSTWLTNALNDSSIPYENKTKMRLAYWPQNDEATRHVVESWDGVRNDITKYYTDITNADAGAFSDFTSYLIMISSSIDELNRRMKSDDNDSITISYRNFRPNFYVESDALPFSELTWKWVKINDNIFKWVKGCNRCILTTIDPDTGVKLPNNLPLSALNKIEEAKVVDPMPESLMMGSHLAWYHDGVVNKGDLVYAM